IYDYLRLLYARIGKTYSPISGKEVKKDSVSDVVDFIQQLPQGDKIQIIVPLIVRNKRSLREELDILLHKGFSRIHLKGISKPVRIEDALEDETFVKGKDLYVLIDRLVAKDFDEDDMHRIADSVQTAFYESEGSCLLEINEKNYIAF